MLIRGASAANRGLRDVGGLERYVSGELVDSGSMNASFDSNPLLIRTVPYRVICCSFWQVK
jgi:hypothetical protein